MEENQEIQEPEQQENDGWNAARERFDADEQGTPPEETEEPQADPAQSAPAEPSPAQQTVQQPAPVQPEQPIDWEARYRAAEAEKEAMRRQLEQRQVPPQPERQAEPRQERKAAVQLPDEMKAEAKVFAEQYPELADLLTEDSVTGRLIRKKLGEYGSEEAAAYAIPIGESRRAAQVSQRAAQDAGKQTAAVQVQQYWGAVEQAHPDVVRAIKNGHGGRLVEELRNWAKTKPYDEGRVLLETLERSGDVQATCGLLARWKADMQAAQAGQPTQDQRRDIARSMAAVPSRGSQAPAAPGQGQAEGNGWDAAKRRWG